MEKLYLEKKQLYIKKDFLCHISHYCKYNLNLKVTQEKAKYKHQIHASVVRDIDSN